MLVDQPPGLLAEDELEALQVKLPGGVASEVPRRLLPGLLLLSRNLAFCLAKVVVFVKVNLYVSLESPCQDMRERLLLPVDLQLTSMRWPFWQYLNPLSAYHRFARHSSQRSPSGNL